MHDWLLFVFRAQWTSSWHYHGVIDRVRPYNACESATACAKETHLSCLCWHLSSWYSHDSRRHCLTSCKHHSKKFPSLKPWGTWNRTLSRLLGCNGARATFWTKKMGMNGRSVSSINDLVWLIWSPSEIWAWFFDWPLVLEQQLTICSSRSYTRD